MDCCVFCGQEFRRKNKGFLRKSVETRIGNNKVGGILLNYKVKTSKKDFVCDDCFQVLKQNEKNEKYLLTIGRSFKEVVKISQLLQ